jgi:signal transduction histidine kinase
MESIAINNLRDSNEFLNALFDNLNSAIFIVDKNAVVQKFNDSFEKLFKIETDSVKGKLCGNAIGCSYTVDELADCGSTSYCSQCELRKSLIRSLTEKVPTVRQMLYREYYIGKQRFEKAFQYTTRYIEFNGKEMIIVLVDDYTELEEKRKTVEENNDLLNKLNKQKDDFLGIAAHDLRNPIGAIIQFSDLLLESGQQFPKDQTDEFINIIKDSGQFSLALLNDLLDINKIETGNLDLDLVLTDIGSLINDNIRKNQIFAGNKNITLKMDKDFSTCHAMVDKQKIAQVLDNFIGNAIKYSFPYSHINIQLISDDGKIKVIVKDQGQGIPKHELEHVFTAFKKTSVQTTANESSTGLGLAINKKIIEGHGGTVGVKSEVGVGSEFYFSIPV